MLIARRIRSAISPEGVLGFRIPKLIRRTIRSVAQCLGIDIYGQTESQRVQTAQHIAKSKESCLFLLHRIHEPLYQIQDDADEKWHTTQYVLSRLFGKEGCATLLSAAREFSREDPAASELAKDRARALALADFGDPTELMARPEYQSGVERGKAICQATGTTYPEEWLYAFFSLHAIWFASGIMSKFSTD